jgi:uncharacterized protein (DUF2336 family)
MTARHVILDELEEALADSSAERRAKTLRRVTDLFVFGGSHFTGEHVAVFDHVFGHLIVDIEHSARAVLAERLAPVTHAPPGLIRTLAGDDSLDIAGPVLERSPALDNVTLVEMARTKSQGHLLSISRRPELAETVTDVLVERGDRAVALSVARNTGARISNAGYVRLVRRSAGDDELTQSVAGRADIPRQPFLKLLSTASKAVRIALEAAYPDRVHDVQHVVAEVASAIQAHAASASRDYAKAHALVDTMHASGQLGEQDIIAFAQAGKFEETAVALSMMCRLPVDAVERAMVQDSMEGILIIAKAFGLSWPVSRSVMLLCAGKNFIAPQTLERHQAMFDRLKQDTARKAIAFQLKRDAAAQGR